MQIDRQQQKFKTKHGKLGFIKSKKKNKLRF